MASSLRVLIVDDNQQFSATARALLEAGGLSVVGECTNSSAALRACDELEPDLALVDIDLGEESGIELAERIAEHRPPPREVPVILISAYPELDFAELIEASPALGFIAKPELSADAVRRLMGTEQPAGHS
jgi:CheY-like chemotaxis protein